MVTISTAAGALVALVASAGSPLAWQGAAHSWVEADEALKVAVGRIAMESAWTRRAEAATQLQAHRPRADDVERAVRSSDPALRLAAMASVVVLEEPTEEIVRLLVIAVETDDLPQRLMALRALARSGGAQTAPFEARISAALLRDPAPGIRVESYPLLVRMEVPHAAPVFAAMLGEWPGGCPSSLFITVTSLGKEMVAAVAAAIEAGGSDVAREAFACARHAAGSASPTREVATERTELYGTFSGYDLPLRMSAPISPEEARSRRACYVARRDESGRLREVRKVLDGATSFVHEYTYDAKGRLVEARVTNSEDEVRIVKPNRASKGS